MKKIIATIVAVALLSSITVSSACAGNRSEGINPIWIPVAVLSTIAAVSLAQPATVVYEQRVRHEPPTVVVYEEPHHHHHHHERYYEHDRRYETARYREREYRYQ